MNPLYFKRNVPSSTPPRRLAAHPAVGHNVLDHGLGLRADGDACKKLGEAAGRVQPQPLAPLGIVDAGAFGGEVQPE
ncbi:hypothetical protein BLA24_33380 [Streptomyces cinnamoneus]|uniref:Uncharacterized protein n=1 Tax=Streptomyces cinnamoneus TaxID=53446 RepID=A0A2G1XAQ7_STRCJ|nr:hypothetical protein [Streptomyces cinnamoneus]PHQ48295.1 hypothetical protein BLA24_33380 [Streptomyces cinnamoneus]PPT15926.1 hypothetical protein CYQ11_26430 [Streptomyces cinnamoneus]